MRSGLACSANVARNLIQVPIPRATAPAPNIDVRITARQCAHALTEIGGVAVFEMADLAQRDLLHRACIRPQTAHALDPIAWLQCWLKLQRMRTIDAVER